MAMPPPFDGFIEHAKRVSPTCLIVFERNRYSVPAALANQVISLRVYADKLYSPYPFHDAGGGECGVQTSSFRLWSS